MRKTKRLRPLLMAAVTLLPMAGNAQLLKGSIKGYHVEDAAIGYSPDGYVLNERTLDLKINPDSTFTFDMELPKGEADVSMTMDDKGYFGLHLTKGKTLEVTLYRTGEGMAIAFKDGQTARNKLVNQLYRSFDGMKYWSPDPSEAKTNAAYRVLLDTEYNKVKALLPTIKDKTLRAYYTRLAEGNYKWCKLRLIMDDCQARNAEFKDNTEFQATITDIDVNDPINYQTNLSLTALNNMVKTRMGGDNEAYCREQMQLVDRMVTLPNLRSVMVRMIGQNYFTFGNGQGDTEAFAKDYLRFAGKDSLVAQDIIRQFREKKLSEEKTHAGKAAPDITLNTPDGKQVPLSSILKGKFTYIDVWATWCGPCVKEIPHLEKLVERFKGNDKVQFVSISVDTNWKAWSAKLDKDRPQWAQYVLTAENNEQFSKDWGITGIPRFIMIDADGNIFSADATRPSDEATATTIEEQIK